MANGRLQALMRLLRSTALTGDEPSADAALLRRFITHRDDAAFAALVERHGPMVLGTCRRVLGNTCDADDAFQAAFLVLASKARSIARPELLGTWLYRVAFRAALRARAARARRREQLVPLPDIAVANRDTEAAELRRVVDEEVERLPDRYRVPVVLCYLEGHTNEEAARRLRCPTGTIASRLATARDKLRTRLVRRGIALTAGALSAMFTAEALAVPVPAALAEVVLGGTAVASVTILAKGVVRTMLLTRIRTTVIALTILAFAGGGAAFLATQPWANAHPQERPPAPAAGDNAAKRLHKLLEERRDAAQAEFMVRMRQVEAGARIAGNDFVLVALRLHEAEMDLCRTRAERIKMCETHLKRMQQADTITSAQFAAGKIGQADAARSTYYRIDAEIRLERAKAK